MTESDLAPYRAAFDLALQTFGWTRRCVWSGSLSATESVIFGPCGGRLASEADLELGMVLELIRIGEELREARIDVRRSGG